MSYQDETSCSMSLQFTQKKGKGKRTDRFLLPKHQGETVKAHLKKSRSDSYSVEGYENYLSEGMFENDQSQSIRNFTIQKSTIKKTDITLKLKILRRQNITPFRKFRVLGWKDNYYTSLLDWSHNNFICAAYLNDLCLYNMAIDDQFQSSIYRKFAVGLNGQSVTSLKCSPFENKIALGYSNGSFKIYDFFKEKSIYNGSHHIQRVGTMQWSSDLIISGSKDQFLKFYDPRKKKLLSLPIEIQKAHTQQICGLKQKGKFISSGGNDNKVNVYDIRNNKILDTYSHSAAVKAMTWINEKVLITGGGTGDKKIKFWSDTEHIFKQFDTGSQVCGVCWSEATQQIVSCQGFSLNQIIIWNERGQRQFTFHGHSSRVLYSALSPSGQHLASGAGDQHLKVWKLFPNKQSGKLLENEEIR